MTVNTEVLPYEILLRFDGVSLRGAHKQNLVVTKQDGVIVAEAVTAAAPLSPSDLEAIYPANQALADLSAALTENAQLKTEISHERARAQDAEQALVQARGELAALNARISG